MGRTIHRIGLVYDLRDDYLAEGCTADQVAEFDTIDTVDKLAGALGELGCKVDRIGNGRALCRRLVDGDRWDLVFSVAEGMVGRSREAQVPCVLEMYGQPYVFSDPLACAVTLDKSAAKRILRAEGLPTPRSVTVSCEEDLSGVTLSYPLFAKPNAEGTGKGVDGASKIDTPEQLRRTCLRLLKEYDQPVLVEEYLPGREFTTAVLGCGPEAQVIGTLEISVRADSPHVDYSYEVKEKCEQFVDYLPVEPGCVRDQVEELALAAYRVLECRDAGRVDVRLDSTGRPSFLEINPLPGLHPTHSDLPMIATRQGLTYPQLLGRIVASAAARLGLTPPRPGR